MNEKQLMEALDRIVDGPGTNADRARKLFNLGCTRTEVRDLLNMNYSQAHSIWKEMQDGQAGDSRAGRGSKANGRDSRTGRGRSHRQTANDDVRPRGDSGEADDTEDHSDEERDTFAGRGPLRLSPSQTRFITQDGHVVVRVDKQSGPECRKCERKLQFSLEYLGFVHADSTKKPTHLEDRYD